jgi:hypothetical protein
MCDNTSSFAFFTIDMFSFRGSITTPAFLISCTYIYIHSKQTGQTSSSHGGGSVDFSCSPPGIDPPSFFHLFTDMKNNKSKSWELKELREAFKS